jgi:hypothetical protein
MKKVFFFIIVILFNSHFLFAQVGINNDNSAPDPSAMLDVKSTTKGMLVPRMSITERDGISQPATGLLIFCTDDNHYYTNKGTSASPDWAIVSSQWLSDGSDIYYTGGNVGIGTSPAYPLHFTANLGDKISLYGSGSHHYGIGIQDYKLQIYSSLPGTDIVFGYGCSASLTETMRIKGTGQVGIGTEAPDASAALDVASTTRGFLPPRMATTDRDAITSPVAGLTIYNSSKNCNETYNGSGWVSNTHYIGESYGGGIVFYVYDNGQHGLIAATADQSTGIHWNNGTARVTGTKGDGLNAGVMNTAIIIATQMADNQSGNFAAKICADYSVTVDGITYGDWYLPSIYELNLLYLQRDVVGGFTDNFYWSSSEYFEYSETFAWTFLFLAGSPGPGAKDELKHVRAVRAF